MELSFRHNLTEAQKIVYLNFCDNVRLDDFDEAVNDLIRTWKPDWGNKFPSVNELLDQIMHCGGRRILADQSKQIVSRPDKPLEKSDLIKAGARLGVTTAEIEQWLEKSHLDHAAHIDRLQHCPEWRALYDRFGRPGLKPVEPRTWNSPEEKAKWASKTATAHGWKREER